MKWLLNFVPFLVFWGQAQVQEKDFSVDGVGYRQVSTSPDNISIHWKDDQGKPYSWFSSIKRDIEKKGKKVSFLMNGAIYSQNKTPAGLYIENGKKLKSLNKRRGAGNFHLQPNGVFLINKSGQAQVVTTSAYQSKYLTKENQIRYAVQSGPVLIQNKKINPILDAKSQSLYSRNGLCVDQNEKVHFWITKGSAKVSLYAFAKAGLEIGCYNALYLDGSISKMYFTGNDTLFHWTEFVTIFSITED